MVDKKLRKAISAYCEERFEKDDPQPLLFDNHAYDKSIVGIDESGSVVYDLDSMVEELMEDEGWTYEEAVEWIDYNTLRAYAPEGMGIAPTIISLSKEGLMERYGD